MKKNLLCLLLALAMMLSMAACGSSDATEDTSSAETSSSASEEASAPASEDAASAENAEDSSEEAAPAIAPVTYPLTGDDLTLTYWYYVPAYTHIVDSNDAYPCIPYAEEATGVHLEFTEVGQEVVSEQFNLMVASEMWTDLIPASEYYTNGLAAAYEDEVIIDLTDYMYEYMPDFIALYEAQDSTTQKAAKTDGMMLAFPTISDGSLASAGLVTRGDWLDAMGFEFSGQAIDLDEFTDLLRAIHTEYDTPYTYYLEPSGQIGQLNDAFDCNIPNLYAGFMSTVGPQIFVKDGTVVSGWTEDGYYDYIQWMLGLFDEGVLYADFISVDTDRMVQNNNIGAGMAGVWQANADKITEGEDYADENNPTFKSQPVPRVLADVNSESKWQDEVNLVSFSVSVSSTSDKVELACKWMNYFYTEAGSNLANYGVEGVTYEFDENGELVWLDQIMNNSTYGNREMAVAVETFSRFVATKDDHDKLLVTFDETGIEALQLWSLPGTSERNYPSLITLTVEETEEVAKTQSDVLTYGQETALRFLTGDLALNEDNWNAYVEQLNSMGLLNIIAVYQNAYDQYIAGER